MIALVVVSLALAAPKTLLEAGLDQVAAKMLARQVEKHPHEPVFSTMYGIALARLGQIYDAERAFEHGIAPSEWAVEAAVRRADLARTRGDCTEAADLRLSVRLEVSSKVEARLWAGAARDALACGELEVAEDRALMGLTAHANAGAPLAALAEITRTRGDDLQAEVWLALAEADPDARWPPLIRARWSLEDGHLVRAQEAIERAVRISRPEVTLTATRAAVLLATGQADRARHMLETPRWANADHPEMVAARRLVARAIESD